jgi:tetratricopeptide (TPR) repeat protein
MQQNRWDEALEELKSAPRTDPRVLQALSICHEQTPNAPAALACAEELLKVSQEDRYRNSEWFVTAHSRMGRLLSSEKKYAEALVHLKEAHERASPRLREEHLTKDILTCLLILVECACYERRLSDAVALLHECESYVTENSAEYSTVMASLAKNYGRLGDLKREYEYCKKDLESVEKRLGKEHEKTGRSLFALGINLAHLKRFGLALELFERAAAILQHLLGQDSEGLDRLQQVLDDAGICLRYAAHDGSMMNSLWQCERCESFAEVMGRCSGCARVWYCNDECQKLHWATHKAKCREWQNIAVKFATPFSGHERGQSKRDVFLAYQKHNGVIERRVADMSDRLRGVLWRVESRAATGRRALRSGKVVEAAQCLDEGCRLWAGSECVGLGTPFPRVECYMSLVACAVAHRDWDSAIDLCSLVLEQRQDHIAARMRRAALQEQVGMLSMALFDFRALYDIAGRGASAVESIRRVSSLIQDEEEASGCGDYVCVNCLKAGELVCSKCQHVRYCSATCQKEHWKAHRPVCGEPIAQSLGKASKAESEFVAHVGSWHRGLSESLVYRRLQESCRLRRSDVLKYKNECVGTFDDFPTRAADKCFLPRWWEAAHARRCLDDTRDAVAEPLAKADVSPRELWVLRALSAAVYGTSYYSPVIGATY